MLIYTQLYIPMLINIYIPIMLINNIPSGTQLPKFARYPVPSSTQFLKFSRCPAVPKFSKFRWVPASTLVPMGTGVPLAPTPGVRFKHLRWFWPFRRFRSMLRRGRKFISILSRQEVTILLKAQLKRFFQVYDDRF